MKKTIIVFICVIALNLNAQIKIGNSTLITGAKQSTVKLLDNKKAETGWIDYYLLNKDSINFVSTEITYDLKGNILFCYQYHLSLTNIKADTNFTTTEETTMGSHNCKAYFVVAVYAKQDSVFNYYSYEDTEGMPAPSLQTSDDYTFIFNTEIEAEKFATKLNDYYRAELRKNTILRNTN